MTQLLWLALGWCAVGLGIAGAVLPILPTTPFMLVAAYCFARSSPRLHRWIVEHPTFGPPVRHWQAHGAIARRTKWLACGSMAAVLAISLLLQLKPLVILIQAVCLAGAATFIVTRPEPPSGL
ncbi:MAG TPA: YbaN family protein [Beijerinckiaceae bacterium]|nr:YbaN family protein [Beijerinckiaceae bacterium]